VSAAPYKQLLALTEREYQHAVDGNLDAIARVVAERDALIATLPATAPESARPALIEAARIQAQTTAVLDAARRGLSAEMATLERTSQTAAGYGRATGVEPRRGTITVAA
jgi:uncharacterized protein YPO0396